MSKKNKNKNGATTNGELPEGVEPNETTAPHFDAPEGYEEQSSDIAGFWDQERGPVHFIPRYAKVFDNHVEAVKPSIIVIGESVGANPVVDVDDNKFECESGDLIGVWYKPGMINLKKLANIRVFMHYSGEKDTGKPNTMKTYRVMSKGQGDELMITDDYRKKSKRSALPFGVKGARQNPMVDDDENFNDSPRGRSRSNASEREN